MSSKRFKVLLSDIVMRVQKPDNSSANLFWRAGEQLPDSPESREVRVMLAAELNALSLEAEDVPSTRLPSMRFAVANVEGVKLFLANIPVVERDNAGRETGVLIAGPRDRYSAEDVLAAYYEACQQLGWTQVSGAHNALKEVYTRSPKVFMTSPAGLALSLGAAGLLLLLLYHRCCDPPPPPQDPPQPHPDAGQLSK